MRWRSRGSSAVGPRSLFQSHSAQPRVCSRIVMAAGRRTSRCVIKNAAKPIKIRARAHGVVATARTQGKRTQHGKPLGVVGDDQPDAGDGQAGRLGVAERFVVPLKPGNAGGGKGPQFKTNAASSEGPGDWATYQLRRVFRNCRRRCTRKRRREVLSESRMREICLSGSMSGKRSHG